MPARPATGPPDLVRRLVATGRRAGAKLHVVATRWETHELPVLRAVERLEPVSGVGALVAALAGQLEEDEVIAAVRRLDRAGFIHGVDASTLGGYDLLEIELEERGRVRLGQWPGDELAEAFLELLRREADAAEDQGQRRRLDTAVSSLAAIGGQTLSGILAQLVMRGGP